VLTARAACAEAALPPLQAESEALQVICEVRQRSAAASSLRHVSLQRTGCCTVAAGLGTQLLTVWVCEGNERPGHQRPDSQHSLFSMGGPELVIRSRRSGKPAGSRRASRPQRRTRRRR